MRIRRLACVILLVGIALIGGGLLLGVRKSAVEAAPLHFVTFTNINRSIHAQFSLLNYRSDTRRFTAWVNQRATLVWKDDFGELIINTNVHVFAAALPGKNLEVFVQIPSEAEVFSVTYEEISASGFRAGSGRLWFRLPWENVRRYQSEWIRQHQKGAK
jgi:hypothetical protein